MIKNEKESEASFNESSENPREYKGTEQKLVEPTKESILPASVSDQLAKTDSLGFEPYVQAIADFLTHKSTEPPVTLSIEGQWGSGKSSFMYQLEGLLKKKGGLIVTFNAWRHDKEDALWAAFALEFIRQISRQRSFLCRWWGHLKLLYYRFSWKNGWLDVFRTLAIWILIISATATMLYLLYLKGFDWTNSLSDRLTGSIGQNNNGPLQAVLNYLIGLGGIAGATGMVVSLWIKLKNFVGSPLDIDLNKYIQSPDYENHISFIENFHKDFSKIVDAYAGADKVYVFIDDLDRCEVPKASDLMQAINLMISSDPRLIFIIGMDREKIAASLAVKNKEVLPYIFSSRSSDISSNSSTETLRGIEYGYAFIEKFIQLPFLVPQPAKPELQRFLANISTPKNKLEEKSGKISKIIEYIKKYILRLLKSEQIGSSAETDKHDELTNEQKKRRESIRLAVTEDSQTIRNIVLMVAPALDNNPRRLKQFINLFRLKTFIANETGLFDFSDGASSDDCLTLEQLGKFVAISLKWPLLIVDLDTNHELLTELQEIALNQSGKEEMNDSTNHKPNDSVIYWSKQQKLMELLLTGCDSKDTKTQQKCNLSRLNVSRLLQVSPRVPKFTPPASASADENLKKSTNDEKSDYFQEKKRNNRWKLNQSAFKQVVSDIGKAYESIKIEKK
jgi:hypothetical protein